MAEAVHAQTCLAEANAGALTVRPELVPRNMRLAMLLGAAGCVVTGVFPQIMQGVTPFLSDGHPYTVDHITQYLELFAAAAIAFVMYLSHMAPHTGITLDADWFYRRPLRLTVEVISTACACCFSAVGCWVGRAVHAANQLICKEQRTPRGLEDDDVLQKPAGKLVALNFVMWMVLTGGVFVLVWCL